MSLLDDVRRTLAGGNGQGGTGDIASLLGQGARWVRTTQEERDRYRTALEAILDECQECGEYAYCEKARQIARAALKG